MLDKAVHTMRCINEHIDALRVFVRDQNEIIEKQARDIEYLNKALKQRDNEIIYLEQKILIHNLGFNEVVKDEDL